MKTFPSHKSILISILALLVYYNINFFKQIDEKTAQQPYNWEALKVLDSIGQIKVLSATRSGLQMVNNQKIIIPTKYAYALVGADEKYYFRYEYLVHKSNVIKFFEVHWLKGMPTNFDGEFTLQTVELPLIQNGKYTAITLGDKHLCRSNAKDFRKELSDISDIIFFGSQNDVLGYPYEAQVGYSSQNVLHLAKKVEKTDYYILLFDWHKDKETLNDYLQNLSKIKQALMQKNPKKIFWIIPPKTYNLEAQKAIDNAIKSLSDTKLIVIDPSENNNNALDDNHYYTKQLMQQIAQQIAKQL
jgi:hypothetical protein